MKKVLKKTVKGIFNIILFSTSFVGICYIASVVAKNKETF